MKRQVKEISFHLFWEKNFNKNSESSCFGVWITCSIIVEIKVTCQEQRTMEHKNSSCRFTCFCVDILLYHVD